MVKVFIKKQLFYFSGGKGLRAIDKKEKKGYNKRYKKVRRKRV